MALTDLGTVDSVGQLLGLVIMDSKLYVATRSPGCVYCYDSGSWIDTSFPSAYEAGALASFNSHLYAYNSDDFHVYRYDGGTTWTDVGTPGTVTCMFGFSSNVYAAISGGGVYRYDGGTTWTDVGTPGGMVNPIDVQVFTTNGSVLYCAGQKLYSADGGHAYRYDGGTAWTDLGYIGSFNNIYSLVAFGGTLFATANDGSGSHGHVFQYVSGTTWTDLGLPDTDQIAFSLATYHGHLFVATHKTVGLDTIDSIYVYGSSWTFVDSLPTNYFAFPMSFVGNSSLYIGGAANVFAYTIAGSSLTVINQNPTPNSSGNRPDTTIYFEVIDRANGVINLASITVKVDNVVIYESGAAIPPWVVSTSPIVGGNWGSAIWGNSIWGAYNGYKFLVTPPVPFNYGHVVAVNVTYPE